MSKVASTVASTQPSKPLLNVILALNHVGLVLRVGNGVSNDGEMGRNVVN